MIEIIENEADIRWAQEILTSRLVKPCENLGMMAVGWHGGGDALEVYWNESLGYWVAMSDEHNRYWNAFGLETPVGLSSSLTITAEINPPINGINRAIGGAFGQDEDGVLYLVHRGKIGGGRKGIGKSAFLRFVSDELELVRDGDKETPVLVVGMLDDEAFPNHAAGFLDKVQSFKNAVSAGEISPSDAPFVPESFRAEYEGVWIGSTSGRARMRFRHGHVVRVLRGHLRKMGHQAFNDGFRDLYLRQTGSRPSTVLEVKTSADRQSLYSAVGQLMVYGQMMSMDRRVAVVPSDCSHDLMKVIEACGIGVLLFRWENGEPVFDEAHIEAALRGQSTAAFE